MVFCACVCPYDSVASVLNQSINLLMSKCGMSLPSSDIRARGSYVKCMTIGRINLTYKKTIKETNLSKYKKTENENEIY